MGQEKVTTTNIVSGLEVAGLNEKDFIELQEAYTQNTVPVHNVNIPRQQDIQRWLHLKHVNLPEIDSDIELLIGANAPRVMEPIQVISSVDNGPYAIKTRLGWTVNGPQEEIVMANQSLRTLMLQLTGFRFQAWESFGRNNLKLIFLNVTQVNRLDFQEKIISLLK
ncbi:WD repeat-containing protein 17-like [Tachysurus ichikawai]